MNCPIDIVYLWVDGSDPAYRAERARYSKGATAAAIHAQRVTDNDELRHSLRSVQAFAPWIRKVWIVTNNQRPYWLLHHDQIGVVDASTLFPNSDHTPSFSSMAIECHLHRIPGLAERFLYANDDMFFGSKVKPDDFFDHRGRMRLGLDPNKRLEHRARGSDIIGVGNAVRALKDRLGLVPQFHPLHQIKPYTKQLFALVDREFPDLVEQTSRERFRSTRAVGFNTVFLTHYALHRGLAVNRGVSWSMAGLAHAGGNHWLDHMLRVRPKLCCVNNGTPRNAGQLSRFWQAFGLAAAPWELHYRAGGAADRSLWQDVLQRNHYRLPRRFAPEDIIVDIGAHTGSFAHACLIRGAGRVVCFEPSAENFELLRRNLAGWGDRAVCIRAAVTPEASAVLVACPAMPQRHGRLSVMRGGRGESVPVIDPAAALAAAGGQVRLLKLDCEGAEYLILASLTRDATHAVDAVACEWHAIDWRGRTWAATDLERLLADHGFTCRNGANIGPTNGHLLLGERPGRPAIAWDTTALAVPIAAAAAEGGLACAHRGALLRSEKCELCGKRDQREAVHLCHVHGECTQRKYKSGRAQQVCLVCPDRTPHAD